ncbi:CdaR family protein [Amphibacillus sp. Q70]|uniref:CdaR family protein n=1 Tax=Amphibacillus sp. Q70 TaxID=3453416 RepID=UPI003F829CD6
MNEWLNKTWVIRIISLLLAIIVFTVISLDNQDTRTADIGSFDSIFNSSQETQVLEDIPVSIQIDDEQYVVSGVPQTVAVTLQGTISVVQSTATQRNFDVYVNLEGLEPGTHTVPLEHEGISNRLSVEIAPEQVEVSIEERATAEYEVDVEFTNQEALQPGYELTSATVIPDTVQVTSSQDIIDRIAMVTAFIDVEGLGEDMTFEEVPVRVYDHEGNQLNARIEPEVVSVEVELASPNKSVPLSIETTGELSEDFRLLSMEADVDEVQVFASEENLASIESISTEPIDLSEITESTTVEVELEIPETVRLLSSETVTVTIEVEEMIEETIEDVEIDIENLANGLTPSFLNPDTGTIDITVSGYQTELADISSSDFQLIVDLDGVEDGEHQLPVEAIGPDDLDFLLARDEVMIEVR